MRKLYNTSSELITADGKFTVNEFEVGLCYGFETLEDTKTGAKIYGELKEVYEDRIVLSTTDHPIHTVFPDIVENTVCIMMDYDSIFECRKIEDMCSRIYKRLSKPKYITRLIMDLTTMNLESDEDSDDKHALSTTEYLLSDNYKRLSDKIIKEVSRNLILKISLFFFNIGRKRKARLIDWVTAVYGGASIPINLETSPGLSVEENDLRYDNIQNEIKNKLHEEEINNDKVVQCS